MSKNKNRHPFKGAPSFKRELPVFLDLATSNGLTMARCFAISHGIQAAYEERKAGLALSPEAREAGAIGSALRFEKIKQHGKRGVSDPKQFRELFTNLATRMHEAMLRLMEEDPDIFPFLSRLTPEQRNRQALMTAETYCAQICAIPTDQPISGLTWLALTKIPPALDCFLQSRGGQIWMMSDIIRIDAYVCAYSCK